jgi:Rps23 Pro-64 3,4-dihydroxylase Tpa1-like proline 4-hydroxylase
VFEELDSDLTFDQFRAVFERFVKIGVLSPIPDEDALAKRLRAVWRRDVFEDPKSLRYAKQALRSGRLVVVQNAFAPSYAEEIHAELVASCAWHPFEDVRKSRDFHFRHHNIYGEMGAFPPVLAECRRLFDSARMKGLMGDLTGANTNGEATLAASHYMPGDYSLPHNDATGNRTVAYVWHLTKEWERSWGGHFYWCRTGSYFAPSFNTLLIFKVHKHSDHFVCPVSPYATGKRLTVNGWWTHDEERAPASKKASSSLDGVFEPALILGGDGAGPRSSRTSGARRRSRTTKELA